MRCIPYVLLLGRASKIPPFPLCELDVATSISRTNGESKSNSPAWLSVNACELPLHSYVKVGAAETDGKNVGAGDGNGDGLAERDGMGVGMDVGVAQLTERVYSPLLDENPSTRST